MNSEAATTSNYPQTTQPPTAQVAQAETESGRPDVADSVETASLQYRLDQIVKDNETQGITTSVSLTALRDNNSRTLYSHNATTPQFAASVNKLPVALLLLEDLRSGKTKLDTSITWTTADIRGGFGVYDQAGAPMTATVQDLIYDMLNYSGNTAVRVLVNYSLAGPQAVNDRLATKPELITTRLQVLTPTTFYLGNSTSAESLWVTQKLLETPDQYQSFIKDTLTTNIFSYYGVRSQLQSNDYIVLSNKVGILDDPDGNNRHDVGVIYNTKNNKSYGYSFMTTTQSGNIAGTAHAEHSLDLLGREALRHAGDKPDNKPFKANPNSREATPETRVRY